MATATRQIPRTGVLYIGAHVITPEGMGVYLGRNPYDSRVGENGVRVGFGNPTFEGEGRARRSIMFERVQTFPASWVVAKPADDRPRESVEDFMARKHDPAWKPAPLPRPRRLPRLSPERLARLMAEQGAVGHF